MIQSDSIRQAIRTKLTARATLKTVGGAEFIVDSVTPVELVLRVGTQKARVAIHLDAIEDLVKEFKFLPPNGWMKIGATAGQPSPGTLGAILKAHTQGPSAASQFAAVLAHVNVAEINARRPSRIRLLV